MRPQVGNGGGSLTGLRRLIEIERVVHARAVALHVDKDGEQAHHVALVAHPLGIRAILRHEDDVEGLRMQLAKPLDPWSDWVELVALGHGIDDPALKAALTRLMASAATGRPFAEAVAEAVVADRTLRRHTRERGLPSPHSWCQAGKVLGGILQLERDPNASVHRVARTLGYGERLAFSNACRRAFGATAETARKCLGLEWKLSAWWERVPR